jgi:GT2 family glycosyltransferase
MNEPLKISVVIPTRDTRELTSECVASLARCDPGPDEVVVVDDGGTDGTASAIIRDYPHHTVVRLPHSRGFSHAANHGLNRASGDLLLLLNSDTEVAPDGLRAVRDAFESSSRLGIAGALLEGPSGELQWSGGGRPSPLWCFGLASGIPSLLGRLPLWRRVRPLSGTNGLEVEWVAGTAMVIRRQVWSSIGPFDDAYRFYCQDADLCYRARDAGWSISIIRDFRVMHHHGGTIGEASGAVGNSHPELMWTDLVELTRSRWGHHSARSTLLALRWGARLRLLGRGIAEPMVSKPNRDYWRASNLAYAEALRALDKVSRSQIEARDL